MTDVRIPTAAQISDHLTRRYRVEDAVFALSQKPLQFPDAPWKDAHRIASEARLFDLPAGEQRLIAEALLDAIGASDRVIWTDRWSSRNGEPYEHPDWGFTRA